VQSLFLRFWRDERGAVGPEWACIMAVLVLGSVAALMAAKQAIAHDIEKAAAVVVAR
jgi:Flp pilus assembly pilin Flp